MKISDELIIAIARLCHAANREWSLAWQTRDAHPTWDDAKPSVRQSSVDGVKFVLQHPDVTARDLHEEWTRSKLAQGWKSGPKDLAAKTHPCLIPYDQLNSKERLKDEIFLGIVRAFMTELE